MSWLHYITSHFLPRCSDCLALLLLVEQRRVDMPTNTQSQVSYVLNSLLSFTAHKLMFYIGSLCYSQTQEV